MKRVAERRATCVRKGIGRVDLNRRQVLIFGGVAALALAGPLVWPGISSAAGNGEPFTEEAFVAAQRAGKAILIDTYATWCQICARQQPILAKLHAEPKFKDLVIFKVDFDTQKDVMRAFHATVQSTLIAFRGSKEVGRSVGETQPEWIEDLLDKTGSAGTT